MNRLTNRHADRDWLPATAYTSIVLLLPAAVFLFFFNGKPQHAEPINGVCLVAPEQKVDAEIFTPVKDTYANWVAVVPYAYLRPSGHTVKYNSAYQHWGETVNGTIQTITYARQKGLKVMLKPHVWVIGQGWAGDYEPSSEADWLRWEKSYAAYILRFAQVADSLQVPLLCIGTEFRKTTTRRPRYWQKLITNVRKVYDGKITYAANWDNYENVPFWDELDYIGIDAYFPLSPEKTPLTGELVNAWQPQKQALKVLSETCQKPILFTEFGYESKDYTADGHWKHRKTELLPNMEGQANAYRAIFEVFWDEPWFHGGFLWKWFPRHTTAGGAQCKRYTPQNKPAEAVIKQHFQRYSNK